jgi:hypothetical protein
MEVTPVFGSAAAISEDVMAGSSCTLQAATSRKIFEENAISINPAAFELAAPRRGF